MKKQPSIDSHHWRKTPLALAVLAALPGAAVAAGPPPNPVGPEFRVNTYTTGYHWYPAVAMDAAGDFVVTWDSYGQDGSGYNVHAQRYNAAGVPQGPEFRVNTYTTGNQRYSTVAMDAAGDFVVTWDSYGQDGSGISVYAQRYDKTGAPQGSEFRVNTYTTDRYFPVVAMDVAGDFVVAWTSIGQDGDGYGIYAQRYTAAGAPQGSEFRVNTYTTSHQWVPAVAMDAVGDFVVTWTSYGQDGDSWGIYAQRYDKMGAPQGSEFRVNTYTTSHQYWPTVAMDAASDFVITWMSYGQDGDGWGIYAQRYDKMGVPQGSEFRVNTYTNNSQYWSRVAMNAAGDFVVTWGSIGQDGDGYGIYAQRYAPNNYNAAFSTPVISNQHTDTTEVPEGPRGTFSFDANFCNASSAYPLTGLVSQTVTLTNGNCLVNRLYGPVGTPSSNPGVPPCGAGSALDFPATGDYSDYALAVGECVTVHYQIGLQNRNRFSFFVNVGGM